MSSRRVVVFGMLAGLLVGSVAAGALVVAWTTEPEVVDGDEAARSFIDAWERSKRGTFHVTSESLRVTADGQELASTVELVQRPPDVLRFQYGGVDGRLDGDPVICVNDPDDRVRCTRGEGEHTYEEMVTTEVARWDRYFFEGVVPLYRVETTGDGCYDLRLAQVFPSPPYGEHSRFCFDDTTGAISYTEVQKVEATDTVRAIEIRTDVDDADFTLPG